MCVFGISGFFIFVEFSFLFFKRKTMKLVMKFLVVGRDLEGAEGGERI